MKSSKVKTKPRPGPRKVVGRSRNGLSAGTKILAAIEQATEILRAEGLDSKRLTIRTYKVPPAPRVCRPEDVKRVRLLLCLVPQDSAASTLLLARFGLSCSFDRAIAFVSGVRSARVYVFAGTVALPEPCTDYRSSVRFRGT